jgi:8-oxo-dGTP pyrophosphatase MutT (NUDIX family)
VKRGGPQVIPRPSDAIAGGPPPWAELAPEDRRISLAGLRQAFTGRVGLPSYVESVADTVIGASAVLAPFYDIDGELYVVLTRRGWGLRSHTGEVSFPGGRRDEGETLVEAALREAQEEVALEPNAVEVLGELDHLMTVTSRSFIVPFVGLVVGKPELIANPHEVDAVLHVPVAELLLDGVFREERWTFATRPPWASPDVVDAGGPVERSIFFFELMGDTIWGATAAMLRHLLGLALGLDVGIDHV